MTDRPKSNHDHPCRARAGLSPALWDSRLRQTLHATPLVFQPDPHLPLSLVLPMFKNVLLSRYSTRISGSIARFGL